MAKKRITMLCDRAGPVVTIALLFLLFAGTTVAQLVPAAESRVATGPTAQTYRGEPLATVSPTQTGRLDAAPVKQAWRPGDPIRYIQQKVYPNKLLDAPVNPTSWMVDPLLEIQRQFKRVRGPTPGFGSPDVNIPGLPFSGAFPPDTVGDVGPADYVQMINAQDGTLVAGWDKTGVLKFGPVVLDEIGSGLCADGRGDPVVVYDHLADRWLLSEFADRFIGDGLCVYISQTPDPAGAYYAYTFPTVTFPDYPKYGLHPDVYLITTNEAFVAPVYVLPRADMIAGLPVSPMRFVLPKLDGFSFQALTPAVLDGPAPPFGEPAYFARHRDDELHNPDNNDPNQDFIELYMLDPGSGEITGPQNIPIEEIDSHLCGVGLVECLEQPNGQLLDTIDEIIMWPLQYRDFGQYKVIVGNLTTDVSGTDQAGIRWFELRNEGSGWFLFQQGTHSTDTNNRWMGSVAMDGSGNIALGYSVVSPTQFTDIRYAGRKSGDSAGILPDSEFVIGSGSASQSIDRWGDYSSMTVDPADDCTFWFTSEFVTAEDIWDTRIAAFKYPDCGSLAVCANGLIEIPEGCDDDNVLDGDGCSSACAVEPGFSCAGQPSVCLTGVIFDEDGDGISDTADNCIELPNPAQVDTNGDGIGNACDADLAGPTGVGADDCAINFLDLNALKTSFFSMQGQPAYNPDGDFTGPDGDPDGLINFVDLNRIKDIFFATPGPSAAGPCVPNRSGFANGSFESGDFTGWVTTNIQFGSPLSVLGPDALVTFFSVTPTHGGLAAFTGIDGLGPGVIRLGQDVEITASRPVLFFDYRGAWACFGSCPGREFRFNLEPPGGGTPIAVTPILDMPAGTSVVDTGSQTFGIDLTPFVGQTLHAVFEWTVPGAFLGPGFFQVDYVGFAGASSRAGRESAEIRQSGLTR